MKAFRLFGLAVFAFALAGCTYGAPSASTNATAVSARTISVNLTSFLTGYSPDTITVPAGTTIQFMNTDSFPHTATAIAGTAFPDASPFDGTALTTSGSILSRPWSSGSLAAGAASQSLLADTPGTYLFGCFFHYGHPMRGQIIVR